MKTIWRQRAERVVITWLFCLLIAILHWVFRPQLGFMPALVYSMAIGTCSILLLFLASHFLTPTRDESDWPRGVRGVLLLIPVLLLGFVCGIWLSDGFFGWSSWGYDNIIESSVVVSLLAGMIITYFFNSRTRQARLEAQLKATELQASEARLKLLETQLDPHLLFNTLANLRVLIGIDADQAQKMLDHMIAYLRATLSGSRSSEHALGEEFERLRDYLELMQMRMGPRLSFELDLPESLRSQRIPSLLLQPLVENAIKHGIEPNKAGGRIAVRASRSQDVLHILIEDTGKGMDAAPEAAESTGFGLDQVRERLRTVFGPAAGLDIQSQAGSGTQVRVQWPLA